MGDAQIVIESEEEKEKGSDDTDEEFEEAVGEREPFRPQPPVNTEDLVKDVRFDLGEKTTSQKKKKAKGKKTFSSCSICLACCGILTGCVLFTLAMTVLLTFATVTYKSIIAKTSTCENNMNNITLDDDNNSKNVSNINNDDSPIDLFSNVSISDADINQKIKRMLKLGKYHDCSKILDERLPSAGFPPDGAYNVRVSYGPSQVKIRVRCDMRTLGGGWTVFQSRGQFENPEDFFSRGWRNYHSGFGDPEGEFWMGLSAIQMLTEVEDQELLVQLWYKEDKSDVEKMVWARYSHFHLSSDGLFRLSVSGFSGTAGDALGYSHGLPFSTNDSDHDSSQDRNCAGELTGGWWFGDCARANLNALNIKEDIKVLNASDSIDLSANNDNTTEAVKLLDGEAANLNGLNFGSDDDKGKSRKKAIWWSGLGSTCGTGPKWIRTEMKIRPRRRTRSTISEDLSQETELQANLSAC